MREWESQSHVKWYCRYHVVIVSKYRRKSMFGALQSAMQVVPDFPHPDLLISAIFIIK